MRWRDSIFLSIVIPVGLGLALGLAPACSKLPHEIFGWGRPENLATICHVWTNSEYKFAHNGCNGAIFDYNPEDDECDEEPIFEYPRETMMFNNSMAKRHIKHHHSDYWGECQ